MAEGERFGEVLVQPERAGNRAGNLGDFQRVRQPRAEMIALMGHENLGFLLQAAKGSRMDDAVPVALERRAGGRRGLLEIPAPALFKAGCERGSLFHGRFRPYVTAHDRRFYTGCDPYSLGCEAD